MKLRPDQLGDALQRSLSPVYLLCGEEPLQREECADLVRHQCRALGIEGREVFHIDNAQFDWSQVKQEADSLSLFASRKLIELRVNTSGPGRDGSTAIRDLVNQGGAENILLLICGKLDRSSLSAAWYKAIDQAGVIITAWPLNGRQLHNWVDQRLSAAGVIADRDAIELIVTRVEGNLLAARQEIERLSLLTGKGRLSASEASKLVADNARYNVFELAERALAGRRDDALRILNTLRGEGIEPTVALWALAREIRNLVTLSEAPSFDQALSALRVPARQRGVYQAAIKRLHRKTLQRLLCQAAAGDRTAKGLAPGRVWDELGRLVMAMTRSSSGDRPRAR